MGLVKTHIQIIVPLMVLGLAITPEVGAVCQEGCLPNDSTVLGDNALSNNVGHNNTAVGFEALIDNTTGTANTATGHLALNFNTTGNSNTAIGKSALLANTTGSENTAIGDGALFGNTTGIHNTATGKGALLSTSTGIENTANGASTLAGNVAGSFNTAIGAHALSFGTADGNTAIGYRALNVTRGGGKYNTALGFNAGANLTVGDYNIDIGHEGLAGESGVMRLGAEGQQTATYIAGIRQTPLVHGAALAIGITADGQLGVRSSSARFKEAIKPMDKASEAILDLKPVIFRYKKDLDAKGTAQFGLVAEEVAKVNPDLVIADGQGKPFTVRYEEINAMLLNEFLKEHKKVEELEKQLQQMAARLDARGL